MALRVDGNPPPPRGGGGGRGLPPPGPPQGAPFWMPASRGSVAQPPPPGVDFVILGGQWGGLPWENWLYGGPGPPLFWVPGPIFGRIPKSKAIFERDFLGFLVRTYKNWPFFEKRPNFALFSALRPKNPLFL